MLILGLCRRRLIFFEGRRAGALSCFETFCCKSSVKTETAALAAGRRRRRHDNYSLNPINNRAHGGQILISPSWPPPTVLPEAVDCILRELSFTSVGGLLEVTQRLLLLDDTPMLQHSLCSEKSQKQSKGKQHDSRKPCGFPSHNLNNTLKKKPAPLVKTLNDNVTLLNGISTITEPGEIHRRLIRLQWIGFLAQQVKRTGPTGRHVVSRLDSYMPRWDFELTFKDTRQTERGHALQLDKETFSDTVAEAIGLASSVNSGRDWSEDQLLLARLLYPGNNLQRSVFHHYISRYSPIFRNQGNLTSGCHFFFSSSNLSYH